VAGARHASLVDHRLAKALSHPLRARILTILNERVASPNEITDMLEERLPNVSYHVRALLDLECVELVRTAQRRGAIEHYYRAVRRPFFTDRDWKRLPKSGRQAIADVGLQLIWEDVSAAIEADTFEARPDRHLSRTPLLVDEQGWGELRDALNKLLEDADRIARRSAQRLAKGDGEGIPTRLALMHFQAPSDSPRRRPRGSAGPARPPAVSDS
jgi:DNA-binding transcriptional ArsR family regulator